MRLFAFMMAILIAFPNIGSAIVAGGCCSTTTATGEVVVKEKQTKVKKCCSHSSEEDGEKECGSKCKCACCFSPILFNTVTKISTSSPEYSTHRIADYTESYFFELPINIWQPPKQA